MVNRLRSELLLAVSAVAAHALVVALAVKVHAALVGGLLKEALSAVLGHVGDAAVGGGGGEVLLLAQGAGARGGAGVCVGEENGRIGSKRGFVRARGQAS